MKISNIENDKLINDLTELYKMMSENVSREKRIEILSFLLILIKEADMQVSEDLYNDFKSISKKLTENVIDYAKRQDFMPLSQCTNTMKYLSDDSLIKEFTGDLLQGINNGWVEFAKSEGFISLIFDISDLNEDKSIKDYRDHFTRLFLNTLLELRDNPGMKIRASMDTALFLKNIEMKKQATDLLNKELDNIPVKFFIQRFQDICTMLSEKELFSDEVVDILSKRLKKNITVEFRDDLFIHIANTYYALNKSDKLINILGEFRDKERVILTLLHFLEEDFTSLSPDDDKYKEKITLFNKLHNLFNDELKGDNPVIYHYILSIQKLVDMDKYSDMLRERIDILKSSHKVDPEMLSQLLQSII